MGTQKSVDVERQKAFEFKEIAYWSDYYVAPSQTTITKWGIQGEMIGSVFLGAVSGVDILACNRVIGLGLSEPATEKLLDTIIAYYQEAGVPRFFVQVSPAAQPSDLPDMLGRKGFQYYNKWVKLYRDLQAPLPPGRTELQIVPAEPQAAPAFSAIIAEAFEWPEVLGDVLSSTIGRAGWKHYFAMDGTKPVAASALHVKGDFGSLAIAGTLPQYQGKGAQHALITQRFRDAEALGCQYMIVETAEETADRSVPSYRNMQRFDFEVAYVRPNYIYYIP